MKVAMITPRYPPNIHGGGEISCKLLVDSIEKYTGHNVDVITFDRVFPSIKSKMHLNYKAYHYLKKHISNYDVFHAYNMELMPSIGILTKKYNIKSVATLNGIIYSLSMSNYNHKYVSPKFYRNVALMRYIKHIKKFTTLCPYYKEKWISDGLPDGKITVIPNMIHPDFTPIKKTLGNTINILTVGSQAEWRKLDVLMKAFISLDNRNVELIVVGSGWNYDFDKYPNITYLGHVPDMNDLYSKCDISVQPYEFPVPIGRALLESMQYGICSITTGTDDYSPIIRDMKDGVLLYPMNIKALAKKMRLLIDDAALRKRLGKSGKKRVQEICSPKIIAKKYMEVYNNMR